LGRAAAKSLARRGVALRLATRAVEITEEGVGLADGSLISSGTVICTVGTRSNPMVEKLSLELKQGRIPVAPDLSVPGHEGLWALGDCALVPNAHDGSSRRRPRNLPSGRQNTLRETCWRRSPTATPKRFAIARSA
jgi:NADH dehydrogenase